MNFLFSPHTNSLEKERWVQWVQKKIREKNLGSHYYIIFGGDGTISKYVNSIWRKTPSSVFGFVGIGSNNSFLKSFFLKGRLKETPLANINFDHSKKIDLIEVMVDNEQKVLVLANASLGLLSECNRNFNSPRGQKIKKYSVTAANMYSFFKGLWYHRPIQLEIFLEKEKIDTCLTQIQILKGPVFAGDYRYHFAPKLSSGQMWIYGMKSQMKLMIFLKFILWSLFPKWLEFYDFKFESSHLVIDSKEEIFLEHDGEEIIGKIFEFQCLKEVLHVAG